MAESQREPLVGISDDPTGNEIAGLLRDLQERVDRIEKHLHLQARGAIESLVEPQEEVEAETDDGEGLELEIGQTWFAGIGIVALVAGLAFLLTQQFPGWPPYIAPVTGYVAAGVLLAVGYALRNAFPVISRFLCPAGMVLIFVATLRWFHFGVEPVLAADGLPGIAILGLTAGVNLSIGLRRKSPWLFGLAIAAGVGSAMVVPIPWVSLGAFTGLALLAAAMQLRLSWRMIGPMAFALLLVGYSLRAFGIGVAGPDGVVVPDLPLAPVSILLWIGIYAGALLLRPDRGREDELTQFSSFLLCALGFPVMGLDALIRFEPYLVLTGVGAFVVFLGIATAFWTRERSRGATFIFAMTGYLALSAALIKGIPVPAVFIALSVQSLLVIATAIWFRSPFIIVANFLIFVGIIGGYLALRAEEIGLSAVFGIVALVSARTLNVFRDRLDLKTEFMRIAYLAIAFLAFPHGLYFFVPGSYIVEAWIGLALVYYVLSRILRIGKYRWMGHFTLLFTALYILLYGARQMALEHRILAFLALGSILVAVSLVSTHMHRRPAGGASPEGVGTRPKS